MKDSIFRPNQKTTGYYSQDRKEMLKFISPSSRKVLDVGCGSGDFGALLKSQKDVEVWGVEVCENAAQEAVKKIDNVLIGDIEKGDLKLPLNYFDCIVFNDVLEHLLYPWNVLVSCKNFLQNGGCIVASIPNIRYYPNIKNLLFRKNWEYRDDGILDKTHFRFFTERSIREMFIACGYHSLKIEGIFEYKFSRKLKIFNLFLKDSLNDMKYERFAVVALLIKRMHT